MLILRNVVAGDSVRIGLRGVSLAVEDQSITAITGAPGSGKTTLAEAICGLFPVTAGVVHFDGADITHASPRERARLGIAYVPARQSLFAQMSVDDNLQLGLHGAGAQHERILSLFPELTPRLREPAGRLPCGLQRSAMLARALLCLPRLLVLDEPWFGLTGEETRDLSRAIVTARGELRCSVVFMGQNLFHASRLGDTIYCLEGGRIARESTGLDQITDRAAQALFTPPGERLRDAQP